MTTQQVKETLLLYRPGTADADDPSFSEALQLCEQDMDLKCWFEEHCAVYQAVRSKLRQTTIPEGLKEQILAERQVNMPTFWNATRRKVTVASLAVAAVAVFLFMQWRQPTEDTGFFGFRERMISKALRSYGMDLQSDNPEQVRAFLAQRKAISDYVLPPGLQAAKIAGCLATTWQGKPVSMICFKSGKPLRPGQSSDLWLFVTESSSVPAAPSDKNMLTEKIKTVTTASWSDKGKTYLLAVEGEADVLKRFL